MKRILLCSRELFGEYTEVLENFGYTVMRVPSCDALSAPVSLHPDMLFSALEDGSLLTDRNYFINNAPFFDELQEAGVKIVTSERALSAEYPSDILFDAIKTDKLLVGYLKYTAPELFSDGVRAVNVKQGYALCSTLLLENAAISADAGICRALGENGYKVLKISPGGIALNGYGCGFIGGASAVLNDSKTAVFFGNLSAHTDGEEIISFCREQGYKVYFDARLPLTDFGGAKTVFAKNG